MTTTFPFGKNWINFLDKLDERQIISAEASLKTMLGIENLKGKTFLDAGCGSGLFSLAALRLGAEKVVSFDLDDDSISCAKSLSKTYGPFHQWEILTGSVLDNNFVHGLGKFDIVYSWGVLHHTGKMWEALNTIITPTTNNSWLFIAIYNDQGIKSKIWIAIKYLYNTVPQPFKYIMSALLYLLVLIIMAYRGILKLERPMDWFKYGNDRGMNIWHDVVDWIGGYPFETATPKKICSFFQQKDFILTQKITKTGLGCNEYVFKKKS